MKKCATPTVGPHHCMSHEWRRMVERGEEWVCVNCGATIRAKDVKGLPDRGWVVSMRDVTITPISLLHASRRNDGGEKCA